MRDRAQIGIVPGGQNVTVSARHRPFRIPADAEPVDLITVNDGDTIEVWLDNRPERVRLVGIDTHEVGGGYQQEECYGPEASRFLKALLNVGGDIWIEQDVEDRDQYNRLLRWVWADFGTGQVYLPTILYMLKGGQQSAWLYLFIYNVAFVIPLAAVFTLAYFGMTSERLVKLLKQHAAWVKFGLAALFLALSILLLFGRHV